MIQPPYQLVLLDRDGVLNEDRPDFVKTPAELILLKGVGAAIRRLNSFGIKVVIATNQSCIGRGIISDQDLEAIHEKLLEELAQQGAQIDHIFYCPDSPDKATNRRKPGAGMLEEAMKMFQKTPDESVMVGDALRDLQAAQAAGCHRVLVKTGKGKKTLAQGLPESLSPVWVCEDLEEAAKHILAN